MKLLFATNNAHKLQEARQILSGRVDVLSLRDVGCDIDVEETGATLQDNSRLKADAVWQWAQAHSLPVDGVFADDTGLEISALSGAPGVRTARWAGEPSDSARNRQKALHELRDCSNRQAQFRTVVTLCQADGVRQVSGVVRGRIADAEYGEGGFGYDPVFIPEGHDATFAELPPEVKNHISHRARALAELCKIL